MRSTKRRSSASAATRVGCAAVRYQGRGSGHAPPPRSTRKAMYASLLGALWSSISAVARMCGQVVRAVSAGRWGVSWGGGGGGWRRTEDVGGEFLLFGAWVVVWRWHWAARVVVGCWGVGEGGSRVGLGWRVCAPDKRRSAPQTPTPRWRMRSRLAVLRNAAVLGWVVVVYFARVRNHMATLWSLPAAT